MTSLVLPATLTAGANENVNDLNSNLNAIASWANGSIDEVNVPNLTAAFTAYRQIAQFSGILGSAVAAGTYVAGFNASAVLLTAAPLSFALHLDPAMFTANTRTTKYRLKTLIVVNGTAATGVTFTPGMFNVVTVAGAAGVAPTVATAGTVAGSNAGTLVAPAALSINIVDSTDFTAPAAAAFVFGTVTSAAIPANCAISFTSQLFMRQV